MIRFLAKFVLLGAVATLVCGCGGDTTDPPAENGAESNAEVTPVAFAGQKLCLACGEAFAKDEEHTCSTDGEKCGDCGRIKGSALCCVDVKSDDPNVTAICGSCGQFAGSEACCKEGAAACDKCGLHKGAPACCKLDHKHDHDHKHE
ncbi:MAG: hypothetical protein QGG36_25260 [Pirellulaceae bacterium]|nr:hypothetical protein [Pirellulaceae bacterium]